MNKYAYCTKLNELDRLIEEFGIANANKDIIGIGMIRKQMHNIMEEIDDKELSALEMIHGEGW